jgi:hypothetical protein
MPSNVQIDPSKSALQNLLALVDSQNPTGPTDPSLVITSDLTAVTVGSIPSDLTANTTVNLVAADGQHRYQGLVVVHYTREALADQVSAVGGAATIPVTATNAASQLAAVVSHYGFIPGEVSWVTPPTFPAGGGAGTGSIQAANSLVYQDGSTTVNLAWVVGKTAMLLHFDGTNLATTTTDEAGNAMVMTNAQLTTAAKVFGTSSYEGNSNTSSVSCADNIKLRFPGDFTMECFYTPNAADLAAEAMIFSKGSGSYFDFFKNAWYTSLGESNAKIINGFPAGLVAGITYHIAYTRSGTLTSIWVNGALVTTGNSSLEWGNDLSGFIVGNYSTNTLGATGFIDEVRISNICRYTAPFTPPIAAFTLD